ncbi:hypothetical protein AVEN_150503-1 [Araneus ventricosus]|uniref:Uncharacterized protein n=1 Tax=Araneus ventricosus TaxID=182803 RepID=A0A4Y2Q9S3_ARAVE|nr:hypothetical protein AVEN_150503-1 [Araneus ventricosus]
MRAIHRSLKLEFLEHGMETPIVKVEDLSNLEQMIRSVGIQKNLKSKTPFADSNLRPRCEGSGKTKDLPTLAPRVESVEIFKIPIDLTLSPEVEVQSGSPTYMQINKPENFNTLFESPAIAKSIWQLYQEPSSNQFFL